MEINHFNEIKEFYEDLIKKIENDEKIIVKYPMMNYMFFPLNALYHTTFMNSMLEESENTEKKS